MEPHPHLNAPAFLAAKDWQMFLGERAKRLEQSVGTEVTLPAQRLAFGFCGVGLKP
jgi:hypothetical protein